MTAPAHSIHALARRIDRLRPDWSNPERYFADRQEIVRELERVARIVEKSIG